MRRGSVRLLEVFLHNSYLITVVLETTVLMEVSYVKESISQITSLQIIKINAVLGGIG
jgi:hypothetical protein